MHTHAHTHTHTHTQQHRAGSDEGDNSASSNDADLGEEKSNWRARASVERTGEKAAGPRVLKAGIVSVGGGKEVGGTGLGGSWLSKARAKAKAKKQAKLRAAALAEVGGSGAIYGLLSDGVNDKD
jgi:hypothetical protein